MKTLTVTNYVRPDGRTQTIEIANVRSEDVAFIENNGIKVSMEDCGFDFALYFDTGIETEDGDPIEFTILANGRSCQDTIDDGVKQCQQFFNQ